MRTSLLRFICLSIVLTLCIPMVACDMQFGGLIGELLTNDTIPEESISMELITGNYHETLLPDEPITEPDTVVETDVNIGEVDTEIEFTGQDTTREDTVVDSFDEITTEPPVVIDPVMVYNSFDELRLKKGDNTNNNAFFTPGLSNSWNNLAKVDDYEAEYLSVFGWAAFFASTPGTFGYQIDDQAPVFSEAFSIATEQAVIDASIASGGQSGSRCDILIPIRDLSGTHTIKAIAKDEAGTIEVLVEFSLDKAVDPDAPVFFFSASDALFGKAYASDIQDATLSPDGSYATVTTGDIGDPYYRLPLSSDMGYVANYIVIKYRTTVQDTGGQLFVGSGIGPTGQGDCPLFEYEADGEWHIAIIDLSKVAAVTDGAINYLRWDVFSGGTNLVIDLGYIAAFNSIEAAYKYDEGLADIYSFSE